jgi:hypothetical protein
VGAVVRAAAARVPSRRWRRRRRPAEGRAQQARRRARPARAGGGQGREAAGGKPSRGLRRRRRPSRRLPQHPVLRGRRHRHAAAELHRHLRHRQLQPLGPLLQMLLLGPVPFLAALPFLCFSLSAWRLLPNLLYILFDCSQIACYLHHRYKSAKSSTYKADGTVYISGHASSPIHHLLSSFSSPCFSDSPKRISFLLNSSRRDLQDHLRLRLDRRVLQRRRRAGRGPDRQKPGQNLTPPACACLPSGFSVPYLCSDEALKLNQPTHCRSSSRQRAKAA